MVSFTIDSVYQKGERVIVEISIADTKESFSFPRGYDQNHPVTGEPQFMSMVKESLERRFDPAKRAIKESTHLKHMLKQTFDTGNISDISPKARHIQNKKKHLKYLHMNQEKMDAIEYHKTHERIPKKIPRIPKEAITKKHCEDGTCSL